MTFRKPHISMLAPGDGGVVSQSCSALCSPARLLCPWGVSRQEYGSGLPFPSPGDLPDPGIEPSLLNCRRFMQLFVNVAGEE